MESIIDEFSAGDIVFISLFNNRRTIAEQTTNVKVPAFYKKLLDEVLLPQDAPQTHATSLGTHRANIATSSIYVKNDTQIFDIDSVIEDLKMNVVETFVPEYLGWLLANPTGADIRNLPQYDTSLQIPRYPVLSISDRCNSARGRQGTTAQ